jgi:predicted regulator of Ras-like GTPase activity (Roadblock/LC7/MglB family)
LKQDELNLLTAALKVPMRDFVRESRVRICILVNGAGQVLSQHGFTRNYEIVNVAALAAAANASARALGDLTGSGRWKHLHHAGKERQLFLAPFKTPVEELILVAIFDGESSLGLVQLFFDRLATNVHSLPQFGIERGSTDAVSFEKDLEAGLQGMFGTEPQQGS